MILPHNVIVDVAIAIFKAVDEVFQNKTFKIQYISPRLFVRIVQNGRGLRHMGAIWLSDIDRYFYAR